MTLVVEDGTGLSTAESYASVAFCDTYFADRGNTDWTGTDAEKEEALRQSTEYLDATYSWIGTIKVETQALGWPRTGACDNEGRSLDDIVPLGVERATAEAALRALSGSLLPDTTNSNYVTKEKVDGAVEVEYSSSAPKGTEYNYISRLLKGLTTGASGSGQFKIVRT